jgi:glycosyltransferase involved in cell wall biosynthesis
MKPGVTAALITKNEGRCLRRCLESMRDWATEIVVADTGSTDDTVQIANDCGARVKVIEWPDDFAAARNASLDMVETEWTLWMDADEWFEPGVGPAVHKAMQREDAVAYEFVRRDLQSDGSHNEALLFRLWRTHEKIRMRGIIHEHVPIEWALEAFPDKKVFASNIFFWHDGYTGPQSKEKLRRNLPYLRRELAERPGQIYYEIELATTLKDLGEPEGDVLWEQLIERILGMADQDEPPHRALAAMLVRILYVMSDEDLKSPRTDALIRCAKGWFSDVGAVLGMVAQVEIKRGNLFGAYDALIELERLSQKKEITRDISGNPDAIYTQLWTNLALVAHQLGRKDVARRNYLRLLEKNPNNQVARQNLALL